MTTIQTAEIESIGKSKDVFWDNECDQWIAFDMDGIPHWDNKRSEAITKAQEANNVIMEHLAKCPTDEALMAWSHDWADEPVNYKCF